MHWAVYQNYEIALCYILAWNPDLNIKNKQEGEEGGETPLHFALKYLEN